MIPIAAGNAGVSTGASVIRFLLRYFIPQYDEKSAVSKRDYGRHNRYYNKKSRDYVSSAGGKDRRNGVEPYWILCAL